MTYAFIVVVGLLGGRIIAAAWMFSQIGWTATWLEISHWGPQYQPEATDTFDVGQTSNGAELTEYGPIRD